ncbi:MAG: response regulator transcription factor [Abitibacteriaceae bacterium]|nr:response regulator transcription factor [Abditibacteriaceae bacterium]MBV9867351.1 response regulator transcription factor [Abditibacteriaceae bacterium]
MNRVLVIDDDVELCELVQEYLEPEGFDLETVHNGEAGLQLAATGSYVLVILDVMLPGLGGFEILRRLRAAKEPAARTPVLMLTARGDDVDRIVGLELGADDYLPKPFNPRELVARIHAILRRTRAEPEAAITSPSSARLIVGDIELDAAARTVRRAGESLDLTTVEFDLLAVLLRTAGRVVTRDEMVREVFGRKFTAYDRSVDMHVSNLRKKLGHYPDGEERIKTVRSMGYIYAVYASGDSEKHNS